MTDVSPDRWWWTVDRSKAAMRVSQMTDALLSAYGREMRNRMNAFRAVYLNRYHSEFERLGYTYGSSKYNVTQGGVDSLHAKLALSRPRPKIIPGSRRFKSKRRAKTLQRWIDGLFKQNATDKLQDDQLQDAEIYGAGVIKALIRHGKVVHERRHPGDILTDPREERRGAVRSLFEVAAMDREMLAESEFVEGSDMRRHVLEVSAPPEPDDASPWDTGPALDQVKVIEAWRLPSCPDKPGRHLITCGDLVLLDDPWEWDCFPFSVLVWGRDPERSMQGQGIVERGLRIQAMLNHHCKVIDEAFERFVPLYAIPEQSGVDPKTIGRLVGQAVTFTGNIAPTVLSPGPIAPDFLGYAAELANRWFAVTGVSQMDARAEADPALESGKAKLIQGDINSGRFYSQGKARERACVLLAELSIRLADSLCGYDKDEKAMPMERMAANADDYGEEMEMEEGEDKPDLAVPAGRDSWRESIPYAAARMSGKGDEAFAVEVWPVSSLSQSIAGRMEEVAQLEAAGHITDKAQARELLDIPVLNDYQDLASARREAAEREIDRCLDGEQGEPTTYWGPDGLVFAIERATNELALATIDEAPTHVLEALRNFIGAAEKFQTGIQPAPVPAPVPGAPPPQALPEPMPPMDPMGAVA